VGIGEGTGPPHHRLTRLDFERLNGALEDFEVAAPAPPERHPVVVFLHGRRGIDEPAEALAGDVKLMLFGFRFLRQVSTNWTIERSGPRLQGRNHMKTRYFNRDHVRAAAGTLLLIVAATGASFAGGETSEVDWIPEARKVAGMVPPKLLEVLSVEIAKSGPAGAIDVCREKAPQLARAASEQTGWNIRRVSLRNRNPKAIPDDWERAVLVEFDRRGAAGEPPATIEKAEIVAEGNAKYYRYMKALPTQALCVACHGAPEALGPGVRERLAALYPGDRAVGYSVGEIRGAITLKKPLPF
jgi:hypothetical protein